MPTQSFADLGVSSNVARALSVCGVTTPFAVQRTVVPDVLTGRDVLVQSPTGSGKTLAFGVPLAERIEPGDPRPTALVLAPTRELAGQIVEQLRDVARARGLAIAAVHGGAALGRQIELARRAHVLVATPGRLEDLIARRAVRLDRIRILVLDEADRMLDMGFRPAVERIVALTPSERQTLFFSATLSGLAGQLASAYTRDARRHEQEPAPSARAVEHRFRAVTHERKVGHLVDELAHEGRGRTLVFVRTKRGVDRLAKRLRAHGVTAAAMHGDKSQAQRDKALGRFHAGAVDTLLATDVAARGIDVDDVTHVINFDAPHDRDAYVHRTGRTGRAGRPGVAVTFVMHDQARDVGRIASELRLHAEFERSGLEGGEPGRRRNVRRGGRRPQRRP